MKIKILYWISLIGAISSITGISFMSLLKSENVDSRIILLSFVINISAVIYMGYILHIKMKIIFGYKITKSKRSIVSKNFASSTIRTIDIFGGDLSWLEKDLHLYSELIKNNIRIRILTHESKLKIITVAKNLGIFIKKYPNNIIAPITASIFDGNDEYQSRALVIKKISLKANQKGDAYRYRFKEYHGEFDGDFIRALQTLFNEFYDKGIKL